MNGNIFQYLQEKKGKKIPFKYKLLYNLPLTEYELIYNGNLNLSHTKITSLPDNLTINGDLYLTGIGLKKLPNNLTVNGNLDLTWSKIKLLPNSLTVLGSLHCYSTPFADKIKNNTSLLNKYQKQVKGKIFYD